MSDNYQRKRAEMLDGMMSDVRQINEANGWFDVERTSLEGHMLIVTEVAEASEAWRRWGTEDATHGRPFIPHDHGPAAPWVREAPCEYCESRPPKPEGVGSEYADILIRLLDQCDREGIDLAAEFERKCAYNKTRGYRHGNKKEHGGKKA